MMGYEPEEASMSFAKKLVSVMIVVTCAACVRKPVTAPRAVVPETTPSQVRIAASAGKNFGRGVDG